MLGVILSFLLLSNSRHSNVCESVLCCYHASPREPNSFYVSFRRHQSFQSPFSPPGQVPHIPVLLAPSQRNASKIAKSIWFLMSAIKFLKREVAWEECWEQCVAVDRASVQTSVRLRLCLHFLYLCVWSLKTIFSIKREG